MLDLVKYHFSRNSGRASPSTREAIVGMLTMSQGFATDGSPDHVIAIIVPGSELILEHFFFLNHRLWVYLWPTPALPLCRRWLNGNAKDGDV